MGEDEKPAWLSDAVDTIAQTIQINTNRAADVNPINLLALALLSTPKHAMGEADLLAQIELSQEAAGRSAVFGPRHRHAAYARTNHRPRRGNRRAVAHRASAGRRADAVDDDTAVLLSYFRNNVVHLFTAVGVDRVLLPAQPAHEPRAAVLRLGRSLYPFLQAELFLPWSEEGFAERIDRTIDVFVREGLLELINDDDGGILSRNAGQTDEVFRLRAIGHALQQAFERYYIAISVLVKNGAGTMGSAELESLCQLAAQRLSLLYAPAAPEFFDKSLFRGFIQKLRELKLVWPDDNGKLSFDERLAGWAKDASASCWAASCGIPSRR